MRLTALTISITTMLVLAGFVAKADTSLTLDLYGSSGSLMPYKGTQSDLTATVYLNYGNKVLRPFLKAGYSKFDYKTETNNTITTVNDERKAAGGGLDLVLNQYVKIRFISEYVTNKNSGQQYSQESIGLIYNQYLNLGALDLNNYAEFFNIPRFSSTSVDSFARFQLLKPFVLSSDEDSSNTLYPFLQYKIRGNDNAIFGVDGSQMSAGLGYKYYDKSWQGGSFAFLAEAHSVVYQSSNLNGDWAQYLLAVQYIFN